jgi:DNA-binding CsgD family transcriptional regulator
MTTSIKSKKYYLGDQYKDIYFTQRQIECMVLFLQNKTNEEVGVIMGISKKTVEAHSIKMKEKLNCFSKKELIEKIKETDFMKFLDSTGS